MRRFSLVVFVSSLFFPLIALGQSSCPQLARNLSFGSRGSDVIQWQQYLISQNLLAADSATGYFGKLTEAAVQKWQVSHGIVSSGTAMTTGYGAVGPRTRAAIASACFGTNSVPSTNMNSTQSTINTLLAQLTALQNQLNALLGGNTSSTNSQTSPETTSGMAGQANITTTTYTPTTSTTSNTSPTSCTFNGRTIASGSSVTAYQSSSVSSGSCVSQSRMCTNGTLSGSYTYGSCTVSSSAAAPTVTLTQSSDTTTSDGTTGQNFTVSWSSTGAGSCTVQKTDPAGNTANPWATGTNGSKSASSYQVGTHHWWIDCTGSNGGTAHADIYHTVQKSVSASPQASIFVSAPVTVVSYDRMTQLASPPALDAMLVPFTYGSTMYWFNSGLNGLGHGLFTGTLRLSVKFACVHT